MAGRINKYQLLRKIHLYSMMTLAVLLILYFFSGHMMTHERWYKGETNPANTDTLNVNVSKTYSPEEAITYLLDSLDISGKRMFTNEWGNGVINANVRRPTHNYQLWLSTERDQLVLRTTEHNLYETITAYHRLHMYGGGVKYDLFLFLQDMMSFSLLVFAITGVYMWWRLIKNKTLGWIMLGTGILLMIAVLSVLL